ncbi:COX15/CtaA family protein [Rhodoferax sp.]|uniref:COX15/CtaA family protein n=1 Tax=Rhodoferax sp. TaxID=50421 RepID=UPI0025DAF95A|nr:COX15/CtaA family protein [Rhodoferax sp.]
MLLIVAGVAVLPVAWIWRRHPTLPARRHALAILVLFLTFDLVVFGAFTRLSDSGLGCPDWPGCYGHGSPLGARHVIAAEQAAMPTGPVTQAKAWIEMLHRYLATAVGALIVAMTVISWLSWRAGLAPRVPELSPWWATFTLFWVCLQGAFGALTVTMKLFPAIVTLHLAGGLVLLALLALQVVRGGAATQRLAMPAGLRRWVALGFALLALQILLGGWVSTNYAVLACTDFPQCQNRWWPEMNFSQGFELWRHLGVTGAGEPIDFSALTAIHYMHRLMAYVVLILLALLAWQLNRHAVWRPHSRALAALVGLQLATGLSNVLMEWPLLSALLHTGGAAALVLVLTWITASAAPQSSTRRPVGQGAFAQAGSLP